jgi:uncharacterized protein YndB with AHSA1/START domain
MPVSTAANSGTFKVSTPSDREIAITRLFDAPRDLVFDAMTKPEHIVRWWGMLGEGYSVPLCEVDLRPGGAWKFVNAFPNGQCTFYGTYQEIARPERLVFTEVFEPYPDRAPLDARAQRDEGSLVTATFTEEGGKTRLTVLAEYPSKDVRDAVIASGMERGAAISYDRLEDVAAELAAKQ